MADNWWDAAPLAAPISSPAQASSFPGIIPGASKPDKPNLPVGYSLGPDGVAHRYEGLPPEKDKPEVDPAVAAAINDLGLAELTANVGAARKELATGRATGFTGMVGRMLPGTSARDFQGSVESIKGAIILQKMAALKAASTTGASGLGSLSNQEGDRLAAAVASLDPNMSDEKLTASLDQIERHTKTLQAIGAGKDPRDPAVQREFGVPALTATGGTNDQQDGVGGSHLSPEKTAELISFARTKPSAGELQAKWTALGGTGTINADVIAKGLQEGRAISTSVDYSKTDAAAKAAAQAQIDAENKAGLGESNAGALTAQGATLGLSDEAAGVGSALNDALHLRNPITGYRTGRDAERLRIENARSQLGWKGTALEVAGSFLSGNPEGALAPLTTTGALVKQGARAGAYGGALAGFGYGQGTEGSVGGAALGAIGGAVVGAGTSALSARMAARGMDPALAAASKAEGVDLMKPMVDPNLVSDYGALESNVYSQPIIRGAAARVRGQIEDRVQALGADGAPLTPEAAGSRIQDSANRFITRSKGVAGRLYDRARSLAGDTKIDPQNAIKQADAEIADLSQNPDTNAAEIRFIQGVRNDLASPGGKTTDALRGIRTSIRGSINEAGLTATQAEARVGRILNAAHTDLAASLPEGAATAFQRADTFYRERMVHVDDVLKKFLGPRDAQVSGEQAFARLKSIASPGGDGRRLAALMRDMEPSERQDVAATIAQSLGRRSADEPFSTALFLSQTRKLSPSARKTIFGPDGAQSIDNLRLLSRKLEEAGKDINHSRSATVLERQGWRNAARTFIAAIAGVGGQAASGTIAGGVAGVGVAATAMGASAARRVLSARAMVNPKVSLWLAQAADISTPAAAQNHIRRLGAIAAREPAIAGEISQLQRSLSQAMNAPALASDQPAQNDQQSQ